MPIHKAHLNHSPSFSAEPPTNAFEGKFGVGSILILSLKNNVKIDPPPKTGEDDSNLGALYG